MGETHHMGVGLSPLPIMVATKVGAVEAAARVVAVLPQAGAVALVMAAVTRAIGQVPAAHSVEVEAKVAMVTTTETCQAKRTLPMEVAASVMAVMTETCRVKAIGQAI